jgi:cold shock CspA family protein
MIKDLRREGQLPPGFSATCELRECSDRVDNVATVKFKAVKPGPNTVDLESAAISGNIPWQYSTSFFEKTANLEEYLWERRKEQFEWETERKTMMIVALKKTYPESTISEKLGVEIDDITQTLDNLRLQGGGGQRLKGTAKRWNQKGFGFIAPSSGDSDVFCHFSAIADGNVLREGDLVEYEREYDSLRKNYQAANVTGGRREGQRVGNDERRGGRGGGGRGGSSCEATPPFSSSVSIPFVCTCRQSMRGC